MWHEQSIQYNFYFKKYGTKDIKLLKHYSKLASNAVNYKLKVGYDIDIETIIKDYFVEKQRYSEIEFSKEHLIYDNLSSVSITSYLRYGDYSHLADFSTQYKRTVFNDFDKWNKQYKRLNAHEFKVFIDTLPTNTMNSIDVIVQSINSQYQNELLQCEDIIQYIVNYANTDYLHEIRANYYLLCKIFKCDVDKETVYLSDYLSNIELNKELYSNYHVHKTNQLCADIVPNSIDSNILINLFAPVQTEQTNEFTESVCAIDFQEFWE